MSSRRISTNNHIIKINQNNKIEKGNSRYVFQINNKNKEYSTLKENKELKFALLKNNDINKDINFEDDDYNYEIYTKPISRYKLFHQELDTDYKYNTISTFDSFHLKYKEIFLFNRITKNRRFKSNQNNNSIEIISDLNLSYEADIKNNKYNIFINKRTKINDKNKIYLNRIFRIFDKNHIKINNKNLKKNVKAKNNYLLNNKNKKNKYNNYNKNKNFSKFSKKNKCQNQLLRKNNSSLMDPHPKVDIQINKENNKTKKQNHQMHEISNYKISTTERKSTVQKNEVKNILSPINDIKSVTKKLFYKSPSPNQSTSSKSNQVNINANEYEENKKLKYQNIYIGLNKKSILEKKNEAVNKRDNINSGNNNNKNSYANLSNHNSKILFHYSNRKSNSILEDTSLFENNNSINESNLKKDRNENLEKKSPKFYKKLQNLKNANIIEEKEKEEEKKDYNKKYKKLIYVNNNYRRKEKNNIVQNNKNNNNNNFINKNENKRIIYNKKSEHKNNIINETQNNQNNNRKSYITKIAVPPSNEQKQNISYINRRKAFQISLNDNNNNRSNLKHNYKSNYNNIINHSKNNLEQKNKNEISRIRLEKTIYYFPEKNNQNKNISVLNNFATPSAAINKINKKIFQNKEIKNEPKFIQSKAKTKENLNNIEKNKVDLLISKSCILNPEELKDDKNKNNYDKNSKNSNINNNNMLINNAKHIINTDRPDKRKEIKIERQIIPRRSFENKKEEQKYVKVNRSINQNGNQNGYRIFNISKFGKDERNSLTNTSNSNSISMSNETNRYINKIEIIKDKKDINFINLADNRYLNKFQRSNHKYHEIKSTSSDKIVKITENSEDIKDQSYQKINRNPPQIKNYTSMDNIKGVRRRYFTKEAKDKQNDKRRKLMTNN